MRVSVRSILFVLIMALVTLGVSGCFQEGGTGVVPTSPGGAAAVPPTSTPQASNTPLSTSTPGLPTPTVEELLPATADGSGGALVASSPTPAIIAVVPTGEGEAVSAPAMTATALIAEALSATEEPASVPLVATSTPLVALQPTTAGLTVATATPVVGGAQLLGGEMTATAIIVEATATAYAVETMTATASGILPPTATVNPSAVPTATMTPDPASMCIHVVARGETTYSIAREYKISVDDITQANGLTNPALIHIGDELTIPGCGETETVLPGEPTTEPDSGACVQQEYMLKPGDNLYRLSLRFGISLNSLQNANNISNIHHIVAGRTLVIPCAE